jgi:calcium-dependent protein kinase
MGVILFILLCGCVPFGGDTDEEIFNSIKHGTLEFFSPYWDNISEPAKDLISHMLDRNTEERYSMEQCFNHAWVQSFNKPGDIAPLMLSGGLDNLRHYRTSRKLEKAVVTFISSQLTTMDETYELKKVFIGMD